MGRLKSEPRPVKVISSSKRAAMGANIRRQSPDSPQSRDEAGLRIPASTISMSSEDWTEAPSASTIFKAALESSQRLKKDISERPRARKAAAIAR
jgi:hypothetical protein